MDAHLTTGVLDLPALIGETAAPSCGALALFVGTVRDHNEGRPVEAVTYEAYEPIATKELAQIEREACEKFSVARCRIVHRLGRLAVGEASLAIVVRSAHRAAAFEAQRFAIEAVKARVPVWKHEHYVDGESRYLEGTPLAVPPQRE